MNQSEKRIVIERYNKRLAEFGHDPRTLGWTKGKHQLRYHILLSHWYLDNASILDFGCGFGDMYEYCRAINLAVNYTGIDINPQLIEEGKRRFPDAAIFSGDALENGLDTEYDYILSSGVHNFKINDNWKFIEDTFELFDKYSLKGFALNFLSSKVEYELDDTYHADPAKVLDLAYEYSNRITLRNDYMPFEFTVFVDKQAAFDKRYTVYADFMKYVKQE